MCSHPQKNPWAEVDLGGAWSVAHLENRPDGKFQDRLGNFRIFADGVELGQYAHHMLRGKPARLLIPVNRVIRSVRVQIDGTSVLHLGALRAFGN